ncbi:MAG: RNA polymerase sigma factor [Nitrospirota bacterium]|nr:RNA polymerase sigma factor [Nitrospirota bacterium]MDH5744921.1 RNA polymerase sigma factor [Candidatus Aminicenantes bacterium]
MNLEEIFDSIGDKLFNYLTIKLSSPLDAEDVLQEVCFRLVRYKVRFRFIRNPSAYVFRVARNEALRFLKSREKNPERYHSGEDLAKVIQDNLTGIENGVMNQVAEALALVPEDQREVIILRFFEELTLREIATVCDVSINTASSRFRYGMQKLRQLLEG